MEVIIAMADNGYTQKEMINKVAQQTGVNKDTLASKMQAVLNEQSAAWSNAGKTEDQINVLSLRVAARQNYVKLFLRLHHSICPFH